MSEYKNSKIIYLKSILFFLVIITGNSHVFSQIKHPGKPYPFIYSKDSKVALVKMPEFNLQEFRSQIDTLKTNNLKSYVFARTFPVDLSAKNSGTWETLNDGKKLWRLAIQSQGAYSLNVIFKRFRLNPGIKVFLYDRDQKFILGAYTSKNNNPSGILAITPVPGDFLVVELQMDEGVNNPGELLIGQVGHDFEDIYGISRVKDGGYGYSASCNVDVNCIEDADVELVKYASVRIMFDGDEFCTGTLVNNTENDGTPYLLTANHCLNTEGRTNAAVFFFDYESPYCDGPEGNSLKSVSGATLIATADDIDFSLVKLFEEPPYNYKPYYSGWDASGNIPQNTFTIHHPWGDVKKISVDENPATTGDFGTPYKSNSHWRISRWEYGTTEKGSSGSGLFDQDNYLVGDLTGGQADCVNPVNDYFQKFSRSWFDYAEPEKHLKSWLDPANLGVTRYDGFEPYKTFFESLDTLTNIQSDEIPEVYPYTGSWGYISGHNSAYIPMYAEKFEADTNRYIIDVGLHVFHADAVSDEPKIVIKIWDAVLDNSGLIFEQEVPMINLLQDKINFIELDSAIKVSDTYYIGYEIYYSVPSDTFALYMAQDRGTGNLSSAWVYESGIWKNIKDAMIGGISSSLDIQVVTSKSIPLKNTNELPDPEGVPRDVIIYPNPSPYASVYIKTADDISGDLRYELYSVNGKLLKTGVYKDVSVVELKLYGYAPGIYIIKVILPENIITRKISLVH
ncbi:MAG: T9SS type A sorting domain-containing protein [Bacteroidales bacterium]|nr:T9SS type A sorting domain-containing protein [Bacteroidales bacterium]